jgi:hypothetical protein
MKNKIAEAHRRKLCRTGVETEEASDTTLDLIGVFDVNISESDIETVETGQTGCECEHDINDTQGKRQKSSFTIFIFVHPFHVRFKLLLISEGFLKLSLFLFGKIIGSVMSPLRYDAKYLSST